MSPQNSVINRTQLRTWMHWLHWKQMTGPSRATLWGTSPQMYPVHGIIHYTLIAHTTSKWWDIEGLLPNRAPEVWNQLDTCGEPIRNFIRVWWIMRDRLGFQTRITVSPFLPCTNPLSNPFLLRNCWLGIMMPRARHSMWWRGSLLIPAGLSQGRKGLGHFLMAVCLRIRNLDWATKLQ
eukprot:jgi/Botrbrau1/3623/Bobra.0204s0017.3